MPTQPPIAYGSFTRGDGGLVLCLPLPYTAAAPKPLGSAQAGSALGCAQGQPWMAALLHSGAGIRGGGAGGKNAHWGANWHLPCSRRGAKFLPSVMKTQRFPPEGELKMSFGLLV